MDLQTLIDVREKYIASFLENEAKENATKSEVLISAEQFLLTAKANFKTVTIDESVYRYDRCQYRARCRNYKETTTYYVLERASFCEKCFKSEYFWLNFEQSVMNGVYGDGSKTVYVQKRE